MKNYTEAVEFEMQEGKKLEDIESDLRIADIRHDYCISQKQKAKDMAKTLKKEKIVNIVGACAMGALSVLGFVFGVPSIAIATTFMSASFCGFSIHSFAKSKNLKNYQKQLEKYEKQSNKYMNYLKSEKQWILTTKKELEKLQQQQHTMSDEMYNVELQKIKNLKAVNSRAYLLSEIKEQTSSLNFQYLNLNDEALIVGDGNER